MLLDYTMNDKPIYIICNIIFIHMLISFKVTCIIV